MIKGWNNQKPEKTPYINIFGFPPNSILSRQVVHQGQNDTRAQNLLQAVSRNCQGILSETFFLILLYNFRLFPRYFCKMCKQTFAWPEHLKTHIRTKHRAELMARAGNYKNEIKEEEEEAKKKPDKTVARMQARLPGGISVQSVPVNEAAKRRVLDFQVTQLSRPSLISKSKETQLSRPSVISKARVTQSRWANTISTAKVTVPKEMVKSSEPSRASFPNIPQSSLAAKRISVANVQQSSFPKRISMPNMTPSILPISQARLPQKNISQPILPKSIVMAKISQPSFPKRIQLGNVKVIQQQQWTNTRNTGQARASWCGHKYKYKMFGSLQCQIQIQRSRS